jgi:hypothetical protein
MSLAEMWLELEIIMLNEKSQSHKHRCHMFSLMCILGGINGHESNKGAFRDMEEEGRKGGDKKVNRGVNTIKVYCKHYRNVIMTLLILYHDMCLSKHSNRISSIYCDRRGSMQETGSKVC